MTNPNFFLTNQAPNISKSSHEPNARLIFEKTPCRPEHFRSFSYGYKGHLRELQIWMLCKLIFGHVHFLFIVFENHSTGGGHMFFQGVILDMQISQFKWHATRSDWLSSMKESFITVVYPDLTTEMEQKQTTQRHYYKQRAREPKPLQMGNKFMFKPSHCNWKPATILHQHITPRSYIRS